MIYLDYNATTPLLPEVQEEMLRVASIAVGNPGSRHAAGRKSRQLLEEARETVARILGATPDEVVFTSGGTEATNLALHGMRGTRNGHIILPPAEHPATSEVVMNMAGCTPHVVPLDSQGLVKAESLHVAPWDSAVLATLLLAHNETGVVQDVSLLRELCVQRHVPWHLDAVQAVGKIGVNFRELGCTTMAVGAHKFYGPRGIGALLIRQGVELTPSLRGGGQERGVRPGTEPVMLAAGMAKALQISDENRVTREEYLRTLRDRLESRLTSAIPNVVVNCEEATRLPNTLSIAFPGCVADALLVALDLAGLCVSVGSACASGSTKPSPILEAIGVSAEVAKSTVRISVGIQTTAEEIDRAVEIMRTVVNRLRNS
ncbi:MAG: cysteine desulfurase [Planctomycetaceae bacterium]|nr:cysteine desulfurase [Planctomycetaceae bacterium]